MNQQELESKIHHRVLGFVKDFMHFKAGEVAFCTASLYHFNDGLTRIALRCNDDNETWESFYLCDNDLELFLDSIRPLISLKKQITWWFELAQGLPTTETAMAFQTSSRID